MNNKKELKAIIEAALFVHGDDGIKFNDLMTILENTKPSQIKKLIEEMNESYLKDESSAFSIQQFADSRYRLQTKPELSIYLARLNDIEKKNPLTKSAIEVLSIIAYQGPIMKSEVDEIRNSDSAYQIQKLRDLDLIEVSGKSDDIGNANLYMITDNFYKTFNLKSKEDLPKVDLSNVKTSDELQQEQDDRKTPRDIFGEMGTNDD